MAKRIKIQRSLDEFKYTKENKQRTPIVSIPSTHNVVVLPDDVMFNIMSFMSCADITALGHGVPIYMNTIRASFNHKWKATVYTLRKEHAIQTLAPVIGGYMGLMQVDPVSCLLRTPEFGLMYKHFCVHHLDSLIELTFHLDNVFQSTWIGEIMLNHHVSANLRLPFLAPVVRYCCRFESFSSMCHDAGVRSFLGGIIGNLQLDVLTSDIVDTPLVRQLQRHQHEQFAKHIMKTHDKAWFKWVLHPAIGAFDFLRDLASNVRNIHDMRLLVASCSYKLLNTILDCYHMVPHDNSSLGKNVQYVTNVCDSLWIAIRGRPAYLAVLHDGCATLSLMFTYKLAKHLFVGNIVLNGRCRHVIANDNVYIFTYCSYATTLYEMCAALEPTVS